MPIIKVTEADLAKSKLLDPGYYGSQIVKVSGLEKSKSGDSLNQIITFRIDSAGKEIDHYFSSKAFGMIGPLHKAVFGTDMVAGEFDTDTLLNKKVDVKVITDNYQGSLNNKIEGWVPYGAGKTAAEVPF
jgi:hypothetical protein